MTKNNAKNHAKPLKKSPKSHEPLVENSNKKVVQKSKKSSKSGRGRLLILGGLLECIGGAGLAAAFFLVPGQVKMPILFDKPAAETAVKNYSRLTGMPVGSEADVTAPTYCIQTPNGMDGARPQAGLNEAGVVFEAIAESGITRFAAVYQNPSAAIIGPIRSLRIYYLEWDTPFDCTIVHAGGSGDALAAVARGYKDLTEDYQYMYRGTYGGRAWNNLFTTSAYLKQMNSDREHGDSNLQGFARMTPEEARAAQVSDLAKETLVVYEASEAGATAELVAKVPDIAINFGGFADFNVRYNYDAATNTYLRSYATGVAHEVYACPATDLGEKNPETSCTLTQLAPTVVVAMVVREGRASDNYHENITTVGSGQAYVFQNGNVTTGTWQKNSVGGQIRFFDASGAEIKLAPGQTFVEAVPAYGSIEY